MPILLTTDPAGTDLGADLGRTFAVVARGYAAPAGVPVVDLDRLLREPEGWLSEPGTMVIVGLSRLMTPSNRVKLGRVLLRPRPRLRRVSVDSVLFVCEPWRMWWHFYAVGQEAWGFTDSFLAETRWKRAVEMRAEDPFGKDPVLRAVRDNVQGIQPFRFPSIHVETLPASASAHAEYQREKEDAFTHEKSLGAIVRRLAAVAQAAEPARAIPSASTLFRSPPEYIVRTDLAVDGFLVGQLQDRISLTNAIADASMV